MAEKKFDYNNVATVYNSMKSINEDIKVLFTDGDKEVQNKVNVCDEAIFGDLGNQLLLSWDNISSNFPEFVDNFENWSDILNNSTKTSEEYFEALSGLREAMSKMLDISGDYLSASFLTNAENMKLMAAAAKGDAEAIDILKQAALEDIVLNLKLNEDSSLTPESLWAQVQELQTMLDEMGNLTIVTEVDDSGFFTACNEMIAAAGLTSDQVNAMFDGMGYEATFASEPQSIQNYYTITTTHRTVIPKGTYTTEDGYEAENIDIIETSTSEKVPNDTVVQAFGLDISPDG